MESPIEKFRQSSIVFEKPGILSERLKILTRSRYRVLIFLVEILHLFLTYQCRKKGLWDFLLCLDLEFFAKIKKTWFLHTHKNHFYQ